jgi:hypothetical protein
MQYFVTHVAICLAVVTFVLCAAVASAQAPDPLLGTWKVNLTKSTYATPAPKSMSVTFAPAAKGYAVTIDAIGADGQPQQWGYTSTFDGSESPVTGNPNIDAVAARTRTGTVEYMKAGKVVTTTSSVLSDDGKTLTVTVKIPLGEGKEVTNVVVYERQSS